MASATDTLSEDDASQTAPGVKILKKIWRIEEPQRSRVGVVGPVSTDIYNVPATAQRIPHRKHPP